ncbi:MAG: LamG domain-containing protein [Alistipes sp.]|nr:LamG domain-containing protein [Alistipes sp.]
MKRALLIAILVCSSLNLAAQEGLLLHYDFRGDSGRVVVDKSDSHFDGKLCGSAVLDAEGVYLGNENGYIDLGEKIGARLQQCRQFSIAVRYKVDSEASLKGQGYFLWAFSTMELNTFTEGRYHAYKLNIQRAENSVGGWKNETLMDLGKPSTKGEWQYVVYTQNDDEGRLFLNGRLVAFNNAMFTMSESFPTEAPRYNWMGRAPFKGDSYLKGAHLSDVRIYSTSLTEKEVRTLYNEVQQGDLSRYDFMYTGQSKNRRIFKVEAGEIVWRYDNKEGRGEISDAVLMDDGHILLADQYGIAELDETGAELWRWQVPKGTEVHTVQPIGSRYVVYVLNAKPAKVVVLDIAKQREVHAFELPYDEKGSVHGQFRNARLTRQGTLLVSNMAMGFVAEYTAKGKELNRWELFGPWSATELENGNILMVGRKGPVKELTREGEVVWETDATKFGLKNPQKAYRLKNGNTVITNWFNEWNKQDVANFNPRRAPRQFVELTPDEKVVWEVSSWSGERNLGPATTFQLLDEPVERGACRFGKYGK